MSSEALKSSGNPCPRWLHRYAIFVACATFLLIIAGALVTSNDAGLSVPDWPTAFGKFQIPHMVGGIRYEFSHRMIAGTVAILTFALALGLWRFEQRRWVRRLGAVAALAVIAQAVLGGITVLFYLPIPISVAHACLAQIFFCIMVSLAFFTHPRWRWEEKKMEDTGAPSLPQLASATSAAIFVQLMLGAAFRHNGFGIIPHVIGAVVVTIGVCWIVARVMKSFASEWRLRNYTLLLGALVIVQIMLGIGSYFEKLRYAAVEQPMPPVVDITTTHVAVGALVFAASVIVALQSYRFVARREQEVRLHSAAEKAALG